jgi:flagellar basal body-associated protein FliL
MNKIKLLTVAVIGLFLLNLAIIGYLFISNGAKTSDQNNKHQRPNELVIKKLNFNTEQQEVYSQLIQKHRRDINDLELKIRQTKHDLYTTLAEQQVDEILKDSLINTLGNYQKAIEIVHFNHFLKIKKMCSKEQVIVFNELTDELSKLFSKRQRPPHRRPPPPPFIP